MTQFEGCGGDSVKLQFRLSYLIYLLTLFAITFAVLGRLMRFHNGWMFLVSAGIPLFVITLYFAVRFPILVGRLVRGRRMVEARKAEMIEAAAAAREKTRQEKLALPTTGVARKDPGNGADSRK